MELHLIIVLVLIIGLTVVLALGLADTALTVVGVLLLLMLSKVISIDEGLSGFSNQGMLTIALLYIIANAVKNTGILDKFSHRILGQFDGNYSKSLARIGLPVVGISAFMNNTPVMALLIPVIKSWARANNIPASKFLLPVSYFTIVGGTCTVIGTSTTLILHGMLLDAGLRGFGFFEPMKIGLVLTAVALLYIILIGYRLLPENEDNTIDLDQKTRDFVVSLKVTAEFKNLGKSIESAGLRKLTGLYLFQIFRDGEYIIAVEPHETIKEGDQLFFTGVPSTILELQKIRGLELIEGGVGLEQEGYKCFEAVVSNGSPLLNKKVKNSNFRLTYDAVILAVHRHGQRLKKKIGDVVLVEGDTLLILAKHGFIEKWYHSKDFLLVSEPDEDFQQKGQKQSWIIFGVLLFVVLSVAFGLLPMFLAAAVGVGTLFFFKVVSITESVKSMNWKVLIVIASAFGISKAVDKVGIPEFIANVFVDLSGSVGFLGIILMLMAVSILLSEFVNNAATAALMFPITLYLADQTGWSVYAFVFAVLFGATSSFSTPIGYQTNMMVQGPGNYKYTDYVKIGLPLNILSLIVCSLTIYFWFR